MQVASKKDVDRIEKPIFAALRHAGRLQSLFVLALPGVVGVLLVEGILDSLRIHDYHNAVFMALIEVVILCPLVLTVMAEINERRFIRWLEENQEALATGRAVYRGVPVTARTEIVTFDLAFSVVVASFKIPSQMFIVGRHRLWFWRTVYSLASFVFGWWGFPYGPVYTVQALHANLKTLNRQRLGYMVDVPGWDVGGGSFGAALPKS